MYKHKLQTGGGYYGTVCIYVNSDTPITKKELASFVDHLVDNYKKFDPEGASTMAIDIDEEGKEFVHERFELNIASQKDIQEYKWFPKMGGQLNKLCYEFKYAHPTIDLDPILRATKSYFTNANFIAGTFTGDLDEILGEADMTMEELEKILRDTLWINPKALALKPKKVVKLLKIKKIKKVSPPKKISPPKIKKQSIPANLKKCNKKLRKTGNICNPKTGRWVSIDGKIGKELIAEYGLQFINDYSDSMV